MQTQNHLLTPIPDGPISVSCNTLTQHFYSPQQLSSLILTQANYHIIPTISQNIVTTFSSKIIDQVLKSELSRNKVLDISMPFKIHNSQQSIIGRHIFVDNKLLGIRTQIKKQNQRGIFASQTFEVQNFGVLEKTSCPIGQFCLHLNNTKIAFIFESQIKIFPTILEQYALMGCQILSIVGDIPFSCSKEKHIQEQIMSFNRKYQKLIIYSSSLFAPTPDELYTGGSFIALGGSILSRSNISIYEQSETIYCFLNLAKMKRMADYSIVKKQTSSPIPDIHSEYHMYSNYVLKNEAISKKYFQIQTQDITFYYLWNIFTNFNKRTPFYISANINEITKTLVLCIGKMCQNIIKSKTKTFLNVTKFQQLLKKVLVIYSYNNQKVDDVLLTPLIQSLGAEIQQLSKCADLKKVYEALFQKEKHTRMCFYTQNIVERKALSELSITNTKEIVIVAQLQWIINYKLSKKDALHLIEQILILKQQQVSASPILFNESYSSQCLQSENSIQSIKKIDKTQNCHTQSQNQQQQKQQSCKNSYLRQNLQKHYNQSFYSNDQKSKFNKTKQLSKDSPICLENCNCYKCKKKELQMFPNQKSCHKCEQMLKIMIKPKGNNKITISCSDSQCSISYCINCVYEFQKNNCFQQQAGSRLSISFLKNWRCFCCRMICDCILCKFHKEQQAYKKSFDSKQIQEPFEEMQSKNCSQKKPTSKTNNQFSRSFNLLPTRSQHMNKVYFNKKRRNITTKKNESRQRSRQNRGARESDWSKSSFLRKSSLNLDKQPKQAINFQNSFQRNKLKSSDMRSSCQNMWNQQLNNDYYSSCSNKRLNDDNQSLNSGYKRTFFNKQNGSKSILSRQNEISGELRIIESNQISQSIFNK